MSATTAFLIALFVAIAFIPAAAGRWCSSQRRGDQATTQDPFRAAPRWAGVLHEQLNEVLAGIRRLHRHIGAIYEADFERDLIIMNTQADVVEKIRAVKDFSASTNMALREVLKLLREGQSDPAKNAEAIALLEEVSKDDLAILKENTPIDPSAM